MKKFFLSLGFLIFLYFFNLGGNSVWIPNESFYADSAKNMIKTGDFLTPIYNGELRLNKPPLTYWLSALGFKLFGINEFGLRFFQALLGILTGVITYLLARKITNREDTAILSMVILNLSFIFIANARYTSPEVPFTFFITLSLFLWFIYYTEKRAIFFFFALLSSALAVLTKGPAGFILPAGVIFFFLLFTDWKELLKIRYYLGTLFVFLASGWWFLYQYLVNRDAFLEVFIKENIKRIYALQKDPFYFYALDINVSFLPYSFLFFLALFYTFKFKRKELSFPLIWFLTIFSIFSVVKMKIPVYVMPAYPAMAIITASFLMDEKFIRLKSFSLIFLGVIGIIAMVLMGFYFKFHWILLIFILLSLTPILLRKLVLFPAFAGFFTLLYLSSVVLPFVENYRPYREVGAKIKELDPQGKLRTYEIGFFHHNLPFYGDRVIVRKKKPEKVESPAIVLVRKKVYDCKPIATWKLYTSSESRFFKFLMDIKRNKRFDEFKLCKLQ